MSFPPIKNPKRVVFYPNNTVFNKIMNEVSTSLEIEATGISNIDKFESIFEQTGSIAGIEFHHSPVRIYLLNFSLV